MGLLKLEHLLLKNYWICKNSRNISFVEVRCLNNLTKMLIKHSTLNIMNLCEMDSESLALLWEISHSNAAFRLQIETIFQNKINTNTDYSKEFLYYLTKTGRKVCSVSFIPTSESFKKLGKYVIVLELILSKDEEQQFLINWYGKPQKYTNGEVTARVLLENSQTNVQFNTKDILNIKC